ncbi:hypothetical protein SLA2020_292040 [Shorea laevis]
MKKAFICCWDNDFPVSLSMSSKRNCKKSLRCFFSTSQSTSSLLLLVCSFITYSKSFSNHPVTFLSSATPCISKHASFGKKSEMFGFPNISVSCATASKNFAFTCLPFSTSKIPPQNMLDTMLITVVNANSLMLTFLPVFAYLSIDKTDTLLHLVPPVRVKGIQIFTA